MLSSGGMGRRGAAESSSSSKTSDYEEGDEEAEEMFGSRWRIKETQIPLLHSTILPGGKDA